MRARRMSAVSPWGGGIPFRLTAIIAVAAVLLCGTVAGSASAAVSGAELAGHLVNTVNPRGTTINLFDYWRTNPDADDTTMPGGENYQHDHGDGDAWDADNRNAWWNQGINSGKTLKFGNDMKSQLPAGYCNPEATSGDTECQRRDETEWLAANLGGSEPRSGIVAGVLGTDGYPQLSGNTMVSGEATDEIGGTSTESLSYLFNPAEHNDYKHSYADVDNLLKVNEDGYYEFNAKENYAEFDSATKSFNVYDAPAITNESHREERLGQFFPFDNATDAFTDVQGRNLVYDGNAQGALYSNNGNLNHFFGLTMETQFIQQYRGHTEDPNENDNAQEVTYNFSGDDDVWVFIDGVLVGDLGGVHSAVALQINFHTGQVVRYIDNESGMGQYNNTFDGNGQNGDRLIDTTTIAAQMRASADGNSAKLAEVESVLADDTLKDNTSHTLQFFYLERGNTDSNMSLKFNFQQIPESDILKVDQNGQPIQGVEFNLYKTDDSYTVEADAASLFYQGVTDGEGRLSFRTDSSEHAVPITLEELEEESTHWVLRETSTPTGYRKAEEMHLYFQNGLLLSDNEWESGAYAQAHVTLSAGTTARKYRYGDPTGVGDIVNLSSGTTFAVVLKREGDAWYPVSGNAMDGWQVSSVDVSNGDANAAQAVLEAAASYGAAHIFTVGTNGSYEVTLEELPGDVNTYYYQLLQTSHDTAVADAEYTIGYYHTNAESLSVTDAADSVVRLQANDNTQAGYDGFDRVFSVTLNVPNIRNTLSLHKTNEEGEPLPGAGFALYRDDDGDGVPETVTDAIYTGTTDGSGNLSIYSANDNSQILAAGTYVLKETAAPTGYETDNTAIRIVVDDMGVYVDAGSADDNIAVQLEPGALVSSMKGFAANDQVDATLHDVQAQPQIYSTDEGAWTNTTDAPLHFQYQPLQGNDSTLTYVPTDNGPASYTAQSGWSRLNITQCLNHTGEAEAVLDSKEDLGDQSLNALFTGNVTILVTNHPEQTEASFNIRKQLNGREWNDSDSFRFTVAPDDEALVSDGGTTTTTADAVKAGDVILPADQPVAIDYTTDLDTTADGVDHTARYGDIVFRKTGTYIFTVSETKPESAEAAEGIQYSSARFTVTVTVTDLSQTPTVEIAAADPNTADGSVDESTNTMTFINTYVAPVSALPLTGGDATARNLILAGGGILLLACIAWLLARRRRV